MFSFILYFRLLIFIMGFGLGFAVCWEVGGQGGAIHHGGIQCKGTHGYVISGFLFAIYLHIYLFTLLVHFVMFIFYVCT